jgi:hypothetical protein
MIVSFIVCIVACARSPVTDLEGHPQADGFVRRRSRLAERTLSQERAHRREDRLLVRTCPERDTCRRQLLPEVAPRVRVDRGEDRLAQRTDFCRTRG